MRWAADPRVRSMSHCSALCITPVDDLGYDIFRTVFKAIAVVRPLAQPDRYLPQRALGGCR